MPWVPAELALAAFLRYGRLMTQRVGVHAQVREVEIVHTAKLRPGLAPSCGTLRE